MEPLDVVGISLPAAAQAALVIIVWEVSKMAVRLLWDLTGLGRSYIALKKHAIDEQIDDSDEPSSNIDK